MMKRAVYILILIAAALFYPLYKDGLSLAVLVAVILLPAITLTELLIRARRITAGGELTNGGCTVVYKGENGNIGFEIINGSVFPIGCAELCFTTVDRPGGKKDTVISPVSVPSRSSYTADIAISAVHCGTVDISLSYMKIHDMLGLFSVKLFKDMYSASAAVIPHISDEYEEEARLLLSAAEGGDGDMKPTTSPGDVIDFREFRPGDRITLIHHKLSARFDKDIVKIMGASGEKIFILNADLDGVRPDDRDEIITHIMSCAYYLSDMDAQTYISAPERLIEITDMVSCNAAGCALAPAEIVPHRTENGAVSVVIGIDEK